ncbi:MAG: transcriptional repressor LexA [Chloroflexota bacterium]
MRDRGKLSERQRNILRYMESYIENHGFPPTIREIGMNTGINSTSVVNYNLNKLVDAGHLSREARASRGLRLVKNGRKSSVQPVVAATQFVCVPLWGQIVASNPVPIPEDMDRVFDDVVEVMPSMLHGAPQSEVFALKVKGDSMIDAMINDGDIVIFRRQEMAQNGEMVAVWLPDRSETTLKYFYRENDNSVRLQPAHPTMDPIFVHPSNCQIQGRVLSVIRPRV